MRFGGSKAYDFVDHRVPRVRARPGRADRRPRRRHRAPWVQVVLAQGTMKAPTAPALVACAVLALAPGPFAQLNNVQHVSIVTTQLSSSKAGYETFTNFRFSYTKLWAVYVKLWAVFVTWFCFTLELALEGPPGPLADGHLLPHA